MKRSIVFRPHRWRRALAAGSIVTVWATFVFPTIGMAATVVTYKDIFLSISFAGSDGTAPWAGPWSEIGESDGPSNGAVQVENDSYCANGNCLQIGAEDPEDGGATRTFDSNGATSVVLNFDYVRHLSSSGPGSGGAGVVKLLASSDGTSWKLVDTFPLNKEDLSPIPGSYDLTSFAGTTSAIKFDLNGGVDDSHISIDNVVITVTGGGVPTTTTSVPSTTTTSTLPTSTTTTAPTTTTTTTTPPSTTTTSPPRTTTTIAAAVTNTPTTSTSAPARAISSPTTAPSTEETTTTTAPTTTTTEATVLAPLPKETPAAFTPEQAREAKENLVVEIPSVDQDLSENSGQTEPDYRLDPREGLSVSFTSAVETLKDNLLNSVLLGVTISILLLLGIDKREERSSLDASPA